MRYLDAAFRERLAQPATTLASAWRLTRTDGAVLGFTDHDEDLVFAGTRFRAASGWIAGEVENSQGLGGGSEAVDGAFSDDAISEIDLRNGAFDGASVESFRVDWAAPEHHVLMETFDLGEVASDGTGFRAELRGLAARLDRQHGRYYRRRCDAVLGDRRCGVDLGRWTRTAAVVSAESATLVVREPEEFFVADRDRLAVGRVGKEDERSLVAVRGVFAGREPGTLRIVLDHPLRPEPAPGTELRLIMGCDRSFSTCRDTFENGVNFRGFPHLPGADAVLRVAKSGGVHDGSAVVL